jgi:hypothetical protein
MPVTEGIERKGILRQKQTLLQPCRLQIRIPPPGRGLGDLGMAEDRYRCRVEQRGTIGNESRKRERKKGRERIKERIRVWA